MTSLQLSNFIKLGATDRVVGITSTRFLFNETMQRQVDEGKTRKIGIEGISITSDHESQSRPDVYLAVQGAGGMMLSRISVSRWCLTWVIRK